MELIEYFRKKYQLNLPYLRSSNVFLFGVAV
jgi:hypothetical protein